MVLFKHFVAVAILALGHLVIASPAQLCQKSNTVQDKQFQSWNNHWRRSGNHPIARIHNIPSDELLGYNGVSVLPARPRQPRFLVGGIDDRKNLDSNEYPYNIIRKVDLGHMLCTGTAVGPRHVMTARHCIPTKPAPIKMKSTNGQYPTSYATDIVVVQPRDAACITTDDFAVLIFDKPIFETDGYFGAKQYDFKDNLKPIFKHAGFPRISGKLKGMRQDNIQVTGYNQCDRAIQLETDTDVDGGQSGGPLYKMENGYAMQIGVLTGYHEDMGCLYSSGVHVVNSIAYARDKFS